MSKPPQTIGADTTMADVLATFPGAQRALFAKYHIGGCQSCAFRPDETLGELCARNEDLPVDEVAAHIAESHRSDARILIAPDEVASLGEGVRFVDTRQEEEFEAVHIPGAERMTQDLLQEIFGSWQKETPIVVYDHTGGRSLDTAALLIGHGFSGTRALEGGIDAYSQSVDPSLPRYRVEYED